MRIRLLLIALALWPSAFLQAFDIEQSQWLVRLVYGNGTERNTTEEASVTVRPRVEASIGESLWLVASGRLRIDAADKLEPGEPPYKNYTKASRPWAFDDYGTLELRDLYLDIPIESSLLRVGKQQIVWGNLDGIRVLDQMSPQSYREFILAPFDESRINVWSVYLDSRLAGWQAELVWTPDTTTYDIPEPDAWFAFEAPRFRYGAPPDAPLPKLTTRLPVSMIDDATYGLRLSRQFGRLDLHLQAQTGLDYEPLGRLEVTAQGPELVQFYKHRQLYGLGLQTVLAGLVVRGEFSAQPGRHYNLRDGAVLSTAQGDQWTAALALDINGPLDTFINIQYVYDKVINAGQGLVRPGGDQVATVFIRRNFAYDSVATELRWYGETNEGDGLGRGSIRWAVSDAVSLELSADMFYGSKDGLFGEFSGRDRVSLALQMSF